MCTPLRTVGVYPEYNRYLFNENDKDMGVEDEYDEYSNEVDPINRLDLAEEEIADTAKLTGQGGFWGGIIGGLGGCLSGATAAAVAGPWGALAGCLGGAVTGAIEGAQVGAGIGAAVGVTRAVVEQSQFDPDNPEESYVKAKRWGNLAEAAVDTALVVHYGRKAVGNLSKAASQTSYPDMNFERRGFEMAPEGKITEITSPTTTTTSRKGRQQITYKRSKGKESILPVTSTSGVPVRKRHNLRVQTKGLKTKTGSKLNKNITSNVTRVNNLKQLRQYKNYTPSEIWSKRQRRKLRNLGDVGGRI
jgi:hypothetical protein